MYRVVRVLWTSNKIKGDQRNSSKIEKREQNILASKLKEIKEIAVKLGKGNKI
jgi:hypothetical protein